MIRAQPGISRGTTRRMRRQMVRGRWLTLCADFSGRTVDVQCSVLGVRPMHSSSNGEEGDTERRKVATENMSSLRKFTLKINRRILIATFAVGITTALVGCADAEPAEKKASTT